MDGNYNFSKRIYGNRYPIACCRTRKSYCCKLVWQNKNNLTIYYNHFLLAGGAVYVEGSNLYNIATWYDIVAKILIVAMLAVTIFSGYDYVAKNIDVLKETKKKLKNRRIIWLKSKTIKNR